MLAQDPEADTQLVMGEAVTVTVSAGKQQTRARWGSPAWTRYAPPLRDAKLRNSATCEVESSQPGGSGAQSKSRTHSTTVDVGTRSAMRYPRRRRGSERGRLHAVGGRFSLVECGPRRPVVTAQSDQPAGTVTAQDPVGGTQECDDHRVRR